MLINIKNKMESWVRPLALLASFIGAIALMGMMFLMVIDVIGRYFFNHPVAGSYELIVYSMVLVVFLGLGYAQLQKAHVKVDIVLHYLSPKAVAFLDVITLSLSFLLFLFITWAMAVQTKQVFAMKQVSEILYIPQWPFQVVAVIGAGVFCLATLVQILEALYKLFEDCNDS